jgi:hypothetical protein
MSVFPVVTSVFVVPVFTMSVFAVVTSLFVVSVTIMSTVVLPPTMHLSKFLRFLCTAL